MHIAAFLAATFISCIQNLTWAPETDHHLPLVSFRYLEMAFSSDSGIRKQDAFRVFGTVASNDVGRPLAWAFLQDHWHDIYEL